MKLTTHPSCSTKVKNVWSYSFTIPYIFMAYYLIKHGYKFQLYSFPREAAETK
jgi:hypothetical protein